MFWCLCDGQWILHVEGVRYFLWGGDVFAFEADSLDLARFAVSAVQVFDEFEEFCGCHLFANCLSPILSLVICNAVVYVLVELVDLRGEGVRFSQSVSLFHFVQNFCRDLWQDVLYPSVRDGEL